MPYQQPTDSAVLMNSIELSDPIRVVVADDSSFIRRAMTLLLEENPEIHVVGLAKDGRECLDLVEKLLPDVLTLDLNMPLMDGLSVLRLLVSEFAIPVIMVSALTFEGAEATLEALELGAVDFIAKQITPRSLDIDLFRTELVNKVKWAVQMDRSKQGKPISDNHKKTRILKPDRTHTTPVDIVGIGTSTGGPIALQKIIPLLPADFPVPVVIAQHIPPQFSKSLANRLDQKSRLKVAEAREHDHLSKGKVLIAPGGKHLEVDEKGDVRLIPNQNRNLACPSINKLLSSIAHKYNVGTLGVVLTGMGNDGVEGSREIQRHGGQILVQDEASSLVYGMPRSIVEQGLADRETPLELIAAEILRML